MSGGFRPSLRTVEDGVTPEASVLASEHGMVKRAGITIDANRVTASGGKKIVPVGTVLAKLTSNGKYAPYRADGGVAGQDVPVGILVDASINVTDGDVITGMLIHGSVLEARCHGVDETVKETLVNVIFQ